MYKISFVRFVKGHPVSQLVEDVSHDGVLNLAPVFEQAQTYFKVLNNTYLSQTDFGFKKNTYHYWLEPNNEFPATWLKKQPTSP